MIDGTKFAAQIATALYIGFQVSVKPEVNDVKNHRTSTTFTMPVEQEFGIFRMIIQDAVVKVQSSTENGTTWCSIGLHYNHTGGGSNGYTIGTMLFDSSGNLKEFQRA
jgi:hypothetical protein